MPQDNTDRPSSDEVNPDSRDAVRGDPAPIAGRPYHPARAAAIRVVAVLRAQGFEAYFTGGCVRDEIMGLTPKDYDVATDAAPDRVRSLFRNTRAVGEHFGVILVSLGGYVIEVATFRRDSAYSDSRRPDSVEFTNAQEDARRRDFTINGLFLDPQSNRVIDFVGGQNDIHARLIRAIGNPADRLGEDHLRALRAVRFAARYDFQLDPATRDAIRSDALALRGVSRERIGMEVRLMLGHAGRAVAIMLMQDLGLDAPVLNESAQNVPLPLLDGADFEDVRTDESQNLVQNSLVFAAALAAWALDRSSDIRRVPGRWRRALVLSNAEYEALGGILRTYRQLREGWGTMTVAGRKRLASSAWFDSAGRLLRAGDPQGFEDIRAAVDVLETTFGGLAPEPLLTGDDLVSMGVKSGPIYKRILDTVYDAQLEGRVGTTEQARALAAVIASSR